MGISPISGPKMTGALDELLENQQEKTRESQLPGAATAAAKPAPAKEAPKAPTQTTSQTPPASASTGRIDVTV